jgi:small subunit ribosomal protein S6
MVHQYETVLILTPVLSDELLKEAADKYKELLQEHECEIIHSENWGLKKLAYPIQKKSTGFYLLFEFKAETSFIAKLELAFRRDERVLRFGVFRLDKDAIQYGIRRREKLAAKKQEQLAEN